MSDIVWVIEPSDKFPEWLEFEGRRYPCRLTPKGIVVDKGTYVTSYGRKTARLSKRRDTFRYITNVPDYESEEGWYGCHAHGLYDRFHDVPFKLDPTHDKASPAILKRLAEVMAAEALVEQKKAEAEAQRREKEFRREKWNGWHREHMKLERQLTKAIKAADFSAVEPLARQLHASFQEEPPLR